MAVNPDGREDWRIPVAGYLRFVERAVTIENTEVPQKRRILQQYQWSQTNSAFDWYDVLLEEEEDKPSTWQERVQEELTELTDKLVRLRQFIAMPEFNELPVRQCHLMLDQSHAMMQYADALSARLAEDRKRLEKAQGYEA